jgi:DNA polymerase-3 subunit epsilon
MTDPERGMRGPSATGSPWTPVSRYAVMDIETTGLSAAHHHRALEIAVVLVDDDGHTVYEWDTLLNPQRDVGATEIHGLTAADVYGAPTFSQIAGHLQSLLRGRVPVAHNFSFDVAFLVSEFGRLGVSVPLSPTSGLCTMRLASRYLPSGPRHLEACCAGIGYRRELAHAALCDARAVAELLSYYIGADDDFLGSWIDVISVAQAGAWPVVPTATAARVSRQEVAARNTQHFLGRLASGTPRVEMHPQANSYLALLDRLLLDRQLSRHEEDELVSAATLMGLSREDALGLHSLYMTALGRLALEDGVITSDERLDLDLVANSLGLSANDVDAALAAPVPDVASVCEVGSFTLKPGDGVVFTGEAPGIDRADLEYQARSLGLRATGFVSGKTHLLVAADPDSISGKARKARDLGVPIVGYAAYLKMLDSVARQRPA